MTPKKVKKKTKRAGRLIIGMSKRLPSDILESNVFRKRLKEIMKGYSGIYALYRKDQLYYVGLTTNLFGRINWHLKDRHAGKWDSFIIFRIHRIQFLKDIETLIVHLATPPGNRIKGKIKVPQKDADINFILKELIKQHSIEIEKIKKALKK